MGEGNPLTQEALYLSIDVIDPNEFGFIRSLRDNGISGRTILSPAKSSHVMHIKLWHSDQHKPQMVVTLSPNTYTSRALTHRTLSASVGLAWNVVAISAI